MSVPVHFEVHLSEVGMVQKYGKPEGEMHETNRNYTLDVITTSALRAIDLALQRHPKGIVHVVQKRGSTNLIFDPDLRVDGG